MLTAPDFAKKQIAFVNTMNLGECDFSFRNENIVIAQKDGKKDKIPLQILVAVFLYGEATLTTKLLAKFSKNGVSLFLLDRSFRTYASICSYAEGNYLLRQKQYKISKNRCLSISQKIVENKMKNQIALLRSVGEKTIKEETLLEKKREWKEKIENASDLATLRGIEGTISRVYFRGYFGTIDWYKRMPRGKIDENNILLDMGYSYLFHFVDSLLRLFGFDTYKGVYHQLFFQRKSLACDMMEPFRCIIDRSLLKIHTLNRFDKSDFFVKNGVYQLSYKSGSRYAKIFLEDIMKNKDDIYEYIRGYYYFVINEDEESFQPFILR